MNLCRYSKHQADILQYQHSKLVIIYWIESFFATVEEKLKYVTKGTLYKTDFSLVIF